MDYLKAFIVGGLFCLIGQVLIDKTKLTPARILVSYVVAGVILGALGIYKYIVDFAGAGATVPLTGFGYSLANGVKEAVLPFQRFPGVDIILGPEMHSTGEVMGMGSDFPEAYYKSQLASGQDLPQGGNVFVSVNDRDKPILP